VIGTLERLFDRARAKLYHLVAGTRYEHYHGRAWMLRNVPGGDDEQHPYRSTLCLKENTVPLLFAHQHLDDVVQFGGGRYCHWHDDLVFSTSDNSDPNINGRFYTFDFHLDPEAWERARAARLAELWKFHPRADYFLSRGGTEIAPPVACNISLTNKCNLRCEICGSQKSLDVSGIRRRHMHLQTFEAVAETIFPVLLTVELNSQGDPLLHPNIVDVLTRIKEHDCEVKVQTNGTLFTDDIISSLVEQHGTVMLSLDAVGPKFDEVREGGNWAKAELGLRRFLSARDPGRLSTGVYPTLTKRTIGEAVNVVTWAVEHEVDLVAFHRYVPIVNSWEEAPEQRDYAELVDTLRKWAARNGNPIELRFEADVLNDRPFASRRTEFASADKQALAKEPQAPTFPIESDSRYADPTAGRKTSRSAAPRQSNASPMLGLAQTTREFATRYGGGPIGPMRCRTAKAVFNSSPRSPAVHVSPSSTIPNRATPTRSTWVLPRSSRLREFRRRPGIVGSPESRQASMPTAMRCTRTIAAYRRMCRCMKPSVDWEAVAMRSTADRFTFRPRIEAIRAGTTDRIDCNGCRCAMATSRCAPSRSTAGMHLSLHFQISPTQPAGPCLRTTVRWVRQHVCTKKFEAKAGAATA
jgi:MoaA/NifB/PqqE/SkfB family radical SAM enzyme